MLVEKNNVKPSDIVSIKLISGEEIIGRLMEVSSNKTYIKIQSPVLMILQMVDSNSVNTVTGKVEPSQQAMVAFAPFMLGLQENHVITIEYSKFITIVKAREDAAEQYKSAVGLDKVDSSIVENNKNNFNGIGLDLGPSFTR